MKISIITAFPDLVRQPVQESILKQAQKKTDITISVYDLRDYAYDKHKIVDDYPYGGGYGMVLKPEPYFEALEDVIAQYPEKPKVVYASPQGVVFSQKKAHTLAEEKNLIFICGHYKGIDQRVIDTFVDEEISIGDYIISGGEVASLVIIDAVVRLQPGVLNHIESADTDSFSDGLLDSPYYTRPEEYRDLIVPEVLLSGHHAKIDEWRLEKKTAKTKQVRPDLYKEYCKKIRKKKT